MPMTATDTGLSTAQIARFHRDGFLIVRGLFAPEQVSRIRDRVARLQALTPTPGEVMHYLENKVDDPDERILSRIENFCPYDAELNELVNGPRVLGLVADLLGEPAVMFKDKINYKLPGGQGFERHQDIQAGWDTYAPFFLSMMVTIDRATLENGCLELAAAHHNRGMVGQMWQPLTDEETRGMTFIPYPTAPGDVAFFDCYTPHGSAPNRTELPRRILYMTYNRQSDGDHRAQYYADKRKSFPPDCERQAGQQYSYKV